MSTTTAIDIPFPTTETLHLHLTLGACRLVIKPGEGDRWLKGTYTDPSNAVPLLIRQDGGKVHISQSLTLPGNWGTFAQPPTIDLVLGKAQPFTMTLEGGASEATIDLGGLPLQGLTVRYGAGQQEIDFSSPNPESMARLDLVGGAAAMNLKGLANAHFTSMNLEGGASSYALDFSGELQGDARVKVTAAMSAIAITVPASTPLKLRTETMLGSVDVGDGFMKKEGAFWNEAALAGGDPTLSILTNVTMGSVRLVSR